MAYTPLEQSVREALAALLQSAPNPIEVLDRAEAEIMTMLGRLPEGEQAEILRVVRAAIAEARSDQQ